MSQGWRKVGRCHGPGGDHDMFPTREDAKAWAKDKRSHWHGRGKAFRCQFCDSYHVTVSLTGRGSVRARRSRGIKGGRK